MAQSPKGGVSGSPSNRHLGGWAIYSETIVLVHVFEIRGAESKCTSLLALGVWIGIAPLCGRKKFRTCIPNLIIPVGVLNF